MAIKYTKELITAETRIYLYSDNPASVLFEEVDDEVSFMKVNVETQKNVNIEKVHAGEKLKQVSGQKDKLWEQVPSGKDSEVQKSVN